jgi:hypothetical protein
MKPTINLSQDSRCPGRDSKQVPVEYKLQGLSLGQLALSPVIEEKEH